MFLTCEDPGVLELIQGDPYEHLEDMIMSEKVVIKKGFDRYLLPEAPIDSVPALARLLRNVVKLKEVYGEGQVEFLVGEPCTFSVHVYPAALIGEKETEPEPIEVEAAKKTEDDDDVPF